MATVYDVQLTNTGYFNYFGYSVHTPAVLSGLTAIQLDTLDQLNWDYSVLTTRETGSSSSAILASNVRCFFCPTEADVEECVGIRTDDFVYVEETGAFYKYTAPAQS